MRRSLKNWQLLSALAAPILILIWGSLRSPWLAYDDAFITYRYADNLRNGLGFIYNNGEFVLGITTPLWGLLLGMLGLVFSDIVVLGHWLSILAWIALALGSQQLLIHNKLPRASILAPLLLAVNPSLLLVAGMETNLLLALMLWCAWAWQTERSALTVVLAALLLLTRQDSAIWLLLLGLDVWRRTKIFPWREGLAAMLLTLPWFGFAWWYYGSPLPNSAAAKIGQTNLMPVGNAQPFLVSFWLLLTRDTPFVVELLLLLCIVLGVVTIVRKKRQLWWLPVWMLAYFALYVGYGVVAFPWYFGPPIVASLLLASVGIGRISHLADDPLTPRRESWKASALPLAISILCTAGLVLSYGNAIFAKSDKRETNADYPAVGRWLAANTFADAEVATIEIGLIGYLSNRPILDTMGLVSRDMTIHQVGWVETLAYALDAHAPDYAVVLPNTAWDSIVDKWWFQRSYQPATTIGNITIYERNSPTLTLVGVTPKHLDDGITLWGFSAEAPTITPGQPYTLTIDVRVEDAPKHDYQLTTFLTNFVTQERYAITTGAPYDGAYRPDRWQTGDELHIPVRLNPPNDLPEGSYELGIIFYNTELERSLGLKETPEAEYPNLSYGPIATHIITQDTLDEQRLEPNNIVWANDLTLQALGVHQSEQALITDFRWYTPNSFQSNYKLFVHLIDATGNIVAQVDAYPLDGRLPPLAWRPDTTVDDSHTIMIPPNLPNGVYDLRVGFYNDGGQLALKNSAETFIIIPNVLTIEN